MVVGATAAVVGVRRVDDVVVVTLGFDRAVVVVGEPAVAAVVAGARVPDEGVVVAGACPRAVVVGVDC